jgi:competence protein ComEC
MASPTSLNSAVFCLVYLLGLLLTALPWQINGISVGAIALPVLGLLAAILLPRWWRRGCKSWVWLTAGLIGGLAILYFQIRLPQPETQDISRILSSTNTAPAQFEVQGQIASSPRLTRSQRIQFWLNPTYAQATTDPAPSSPIASSPKGSPTALQAVTGKLYVTVPLLQGTGLYLGQTVVVAGSLYLPKPATNPGGFNFQAYLAQSGGFAGLSGRQVSLLNDSQYTLPILPAIRRRIVRSQVRGLGVPEGPLVSAMVMGNKGVDVPYSLQDQFIRLGLAHVLAASGFQVSLLVGVVLTLSRRLAAQVRFGLGTGIVIAYVGLTGIQASVLRAAVMGLVALFALSTERKVKPLGSVLLAATVLLLFNPLWIWDLGFQFSFLATLGLLVTSPHLVKWFDWVPAAIAPLIAVPLAAYLWTIPLQLYVFGIVSLYSIPINILTTPLVTITSMGGMISALTALIYPPAGSILAWLFYYPTHLLVQLVAFGNRLPGNQFAVGTISPIQVVAIYGLFGLIWWQPRWQRYWGIAVALGISLVAIPVGYAQATLSQVTVLATAKEPTIVIQDRGRVMLVNSVREEEAAFTVLPFFKQQGINRIDGAIAADSEASHLAGWYRVSKDIPVKVLYKSPGFEQMVKLATRANPTATTLAHPAQYLPLSVNQTVAIDAISTRLISSAPLVLQLQIHNQSWLLLGALPVADQQRLVAAKVLPTAQVLWWSGQGLTPQLLAQVQPDVAIAASTIPPQTATQLQKQGATVYSIDRDGAVQWNARQGFRATLASNDDAI